MDRCKRHGREDTRTRHKSARAESWRRSPGRCCDARKRKMQVPEKLDTRPTVCFSGVVCLLGSQGRLAQEAGAAVAGQRRDAQLQDTQRRTTSRLRDVEHMHAVVHKANFASKCSKYCKLGQLLSLPLSLRCRKMHNVLAPSTFGSIV